jgi:hypothetical protein
MIVNIPVSARRRIELLSIKPFLDIPNRPELDRRSAARRPATS